MRGFLVGLLCAVVMSNGHVVAGSIVAGTIVDSDRFRVGPPTSGPRDGGFLCGVAVGLCVDDMIDYAAMTTAWDKSVSGGVSELEALITRAFMALPAAQFSAAQFNQAWLNMARDPLVIEALGIGAESGLLVPGQLPFRDEAADLQTTAASALFGIGLIALGISRRQRSARG